MVLSESFSGRRIGRAHAVGSVAGRDIPNDNGGIRNRCTSPTVCRQARSCRLGFPSLSKYLPSSDFTAVGSPEPSANTIPPAATSIVAAIIERIIRKKAVLESLMVDLPAPWNRSTRRRLVCVQLTAAVRNTVSVPPSAVIVAQRRIARRPRPRPAVGSVKAGRKTDARPAADTGTAPRRTACRCAHRS